MFRRRLSRYRRGVGGGGSPYLRKRISGKHQAGDEILVSLYATHAWATNSNLAISVSGGIAGDISGQMINSEDFSRYLARFVAGSTGDIDLTFTLGNSGSGGVAQVGEVEVVNLAALLTR